MSISVELDLGYEFTVKAGIQDVFDLVSDVPRSVSHFPKVEQLDDLGGGAYRWRMEKVGTAQVNIQTIYASQYVSDRKKGSVVWSPVAGEGNAQVGGSWKLSATKKGTKLQLRIHGVADVPLPALMKVVVVPVVQAEFEKLVETYIDNLIREFGGEV
jgi:carbon monoxide dehydrogenase subunit G